MRTAPAWVVSGILLSVPSAAHAGAGVWTRSTLYGGEVSSLLVDAATPSTLYLAGTGRTPVYKSTDAGGSWTAASSGLPEGARVVLASSPALPSTLYAGGAYGGVFRSTDSGATWTGAAGGLPPQEQVLAVAVDSLVPSTVYAGTQGFGVFKSTNSGASWTAANAGLGNLNTLALAIQPSAPATLYAGTVGGVYRSTNAGGSWTLAGLSSPVRTLAVDPESPDTLYAGTSSGSGMVRSTDAGSSWVPLDVGLGAAYHNAALLVAPTTPTTTLYLGTLYGVFKSTDAGASWSPANAGRTSMPVYALAIHPAAPTTVYAGSGGDGVLKSTDAGASWAPVNTGFVNLTLNALVRHPSDPVTLYAGTSTAGHDGGIFKSTDGGSSWASMNTGMVSPPRSVSSLEINALAIDPSTPATLFSGTGCNLFKSTDGGGTWTERAFAEGYCWKVGAIVISAAFPQDMYVASTPPAGPTTILRSTDAGDTWAPADAGLPQIAWPPHVLALDRGGSTSLYAGTLQGLFKSTDSGASWTPAGPGMPAVAPRVFSIAIDPTAAEKVYALTSAGAFTSTNAGASWARASTGLPPGGVSTPPGAALIIDPAQPAILYASSFQRVFKSTNSGGTWAAVSPRLAGPVGPLTLGGTTGGLYAGTHQEGLWEAAPPPAAFVKGDLNGDGQPDLVFRSTLAGAQNKAWLMNGAARVSEAAIAPDAADAGWSIRGVDDFDDDLRNDLVFWNQVTGQVEFWLMNGTTRLGAPVPLGNGPVLDPGWELAATTDFNHDTLPDLVWRNATSQRIVIWAMNGSRKFADVYSTPAQAVDGNWAIVATLDYNDDGNTDFLWYNETSGKIVTWYMDAWVARTSGQFTTPPNAGNSNWKVVASGDYSREYVPGTPPLGSPDIVWRNETSGNQVVWHLDFASTRVHGEFTSPAANTPALEWTIVGPR